MILDEIGYHAPIITDVSGAVFFAVYYPSIVLFIIMGILINQITNGLLKKICRVKRQTQKPFHGSIANNYAMPSGHAQAVAYITTLLLFFSPLFFCIFFLIWLCTLRQRYVYKNHTGLQLLAGSILGIVFGYISYIWLKNNM